MIKLIEVNEDNWMAFAALRVREEQQGFLDSALGILARGYAYRASRARVFGVAEGEKAVGLALVKDLEEEPACYDLQQFMIDESRQLRHGGPGVDPGRAGKGAKVPLRGGLREKGERRRPASL